ncbi:hypothetical protein GQ53DRAFT_753546 [Thozetella sp. PMI_491]|nr:hypothetical protein GQ53DRAFT_753546 [Thozetella sp. PMI_491]
MKPAATLLASYGAAVAAASQAPLRENPSDLVSASPYLFVNPPPHTAAGRRIPTSYESAVLARRILALTPLGTIATTFPVDDASTLENRPAGLGGLPHGLMEYIADCESDLSKDQSGNPTFLAINIETSFKNVAKGSNVSLSVQWAPRYLPDKRIKSASVSGVPLLDGLLRRIGLLPETEGDDESDYEPVPYSAANLPRFSLLGYVEPIPHGDDLTPGAMGSKIASCFVDTHPDARFWLPGSRVHESHFVRLVVEQVYWIGGFGDRAYIGWIPVEEWRNVTRQEWESVRLPGEQKGWKEWSVKEKGADL